MGVSAVLLLFVIAAATFVGRTGTSFKLPWLTGLTCFLLAACLAAQLNEPNLLSLVERNGSAIRAGETYRLFTALWFQDGGLAGGSFNIAMLAVLGSTAEQALTRSAWLTVYLAGGLLSELVALEWQPTGAGNSIAYMSLAGALLGLALRRRMSRSNEIVALLGLGAGVLLCLRTDIHGAATLIGCVLLVLVHGLSDSTKLQRAS